MKLQKLFSENFHKAACEQECPLSSVKIIFAKIKQRTINNEYYKM